MTLSGELTYFAIVLSERRVRPPKPTTLPESVNIGYITLARKRSLMPPRFVTYDQPRLLKKLVGISRTESLRAQSVAAVERISQMEALYHALVDAALTEIGQSDIAASWVCCMLRSNQRMAKSLTASILSRSDAS